MVNEIAFAAMNAYVAAMTNVGLGYMLDTTEFNAVAKGKLAVGVIAGQRLFATHVQLDELDQTPNEEIRARLRAAFEVVAAESLPTESMVWDVSRWGQAKWPGKDSAFEAMRARLQELDKSGPNRNLNQHRDILIAETAIKNGFVLVSRDARLRTVTTEFGGRAIDREEFKRVVACR
jgi:hypothetical protein